MIHMISDSCLIKVEIPKFHAVVQPDHPSNLHHWQVGSVLVLLSQFKPLADTASEALEIADVMEENENELIDEGL
jgi:hypothetical protein